MADLKGFRPDPTPPNPSKSGKGPIPAGQYLVMATSSELRDTKAKTGQYLEVEFTILEGDQKDLRVWNKFNIVNPNPEAERISKEQLSALAHAVQVLNPRDSVDFHGKPLWIRVGIDGNGYNKITAYEPREAGIQVQAPAYGTKAMSQTDFDQQDDAIPF